MLEPVECITWEDKPLAYIIRAQFAPEQTTFLTSPDLNFQAGFVVYPAGGEIGRHVTVAISSVRPSVSSAITLCA